MLNTAETLLERQVPGAGKLSEFPDGSRIYTAVEDETLTEIAKAFGLDPHELMATNLENYSDLSVDAPLCEGTLLELPKVSELAGSEARANAKNLEAGLLGWIPIFVYGSGEKADQRTDGLLFECDKKYTVACNGREMKLSEFCQYAGNKKNRPRECIIITETSETLVDYEARRAPALSEGLQKQDSSFEQGAGATESKEEFLAREMKIVNVAEAGSVVKVGTVGSQSRRIGLVKERSPDGWYRVVMLTDSRKAHPPERQETEVRAYHIEQTPLEVQKAELEVWAVDFLRAIHDVSATFGGPSTKLKTIHEHLVSEVAHLREEASAKTFKPQEYVHSFVHTLKPREWQQTAESLKRPGHLETERSFSSRICDAIRARNSLQVFQTPLSCRMQTPTHRQVVAGKEDGETISRDRVSAELVDAAKDKLSVLGEKRKRLSAELAAISQQRAEQEVSEREMALAQDQAAATTFCAQHYELAATMTAAHQECKISRDLTILLRDLVAFQGASRLALRLLCVQKLLNALERDLSFLSERLRNESYFGRELGLLSTSAPGEMLGSSMYWKFCASELQSSAEYRALTLKAAKRIQRHCSTVLSNLGPEPPSSFLTTETGPDNKGLSATFGSGTIRWHAEADSLFFGAGSSVVRTLHSSSQQSKPKVPELVEAGTHSVVLRFLVPADEYQVAWEKGCQHSRGTAWLNPLRAMESLYTVTGLAPATEYRFRFRGFNAGIWGEWSKAVLYSTVSESAAKCDLLTFASSELEDVPVLRFWRARNRDEEMLVRNLGNQTSDADIFQKSLSVAFRRLHSSTVSLIEKLEAAARSSEAHGHRNLTLASMTAKPQRLSTGPGLASSNASMFKASGDLALTPAQLLAASRPPQAATSIGMDAIVAAGLAKKAKPLFGGTAEVTRNNNIMSALAAKPAPGTPGAGGNRPLLSELTPKEMETLKSLMPKVTGAPSIGVSRAGPAPVMCFNCRQAVAAGPPGLCPSCAQAPGLGRGIPGVGVIPPRAADMPPTVSSQQTSTAAEGNSVEARFFVQAQRKQLSIKLASRRPASTSAGPRSDLSSVASPMHAVASPMHASASPMHASGQPMRLLPGLQMPGAPIEVVEMGGAGLLAGQKRRAQPLGEQERPAKR